MTREDPNLIIDLDGDPPLEYILWLRRKIREANQNAMAASEAWQKASKEADEYCRSQRYNYWQARDHRKINPHMADAMDKWSWWEREAKRFAEHLRSELAILEYLEKMHGRGEVVRLDEYALSSSVSAWDDWMAKEASAA